jgi:hypothetical protein
MTRFRRGDDQAPGNGNGGRGGTPGEEKKPGHTTHGGFQAVALYRERGFDLEKPGDRFLHAWKQALISDLGGAGEISVLQSTLVDECVSLLIILSKMSEWVESHGIIQPDGQLAACLRHSFISYQNTLRINLIACHEHMKKRAKSSKIPTLEDLLKESSQKEEHGHGNTGGTGCEAGRIGGQSPE